jgi:hypothetical protein
VLARVTRYHVTVIIVINYHIHSVQDYNIALDSGSDSDTDDDLDCSNPVIKSIGYEGKA